MPPTFSAAELRALACCSDLLVSPLDHDTVDAWRSAVNREVKALLEADSAGFLLPVPDGLALYSEEHDPAELARYPDYPPPPLVDGLPLWEGMIRAQVGTLADLYGPDYRLYTGSTYYQEYAGANGAHDTLAAAMSLGGTDARGMACLHFWHARPDGRRFGAREIALLEVLYPSFRAGVQAQTAWGAHRRDLLGALDGLGQAVLVCGGHGRVLHETPALSEMLAADPEAEALRSAMRSAALAVCRLVSSAGSSSADGSWPVVAQAQTARARYVAQASIHRSASPGADPLVLVSLARRTPVPRSEEELRATFGLTRAEVRVAHLIARGLPNADVARELFISPHTARRHTERILLKLGIRSRAEVASQLLC